MQNSKESDIEKSGIYREIPEIFHSNLCEFGSKDANFCKMSNKIRETFDENLLKC